MRAEGSECAGSQRVCDLARTLAIVSVCATTSTTLPEDEPELDGPPDPRPQHLPWPEVTDGRGTPGASPALPGPPAPGR